MTYKFGKRLADINRSEKEKDFIVKRTGDLFDIYMHPERPKSIYVFELGTVQFVDEFPLSESLYGNKIDHKIDPSRAEKLYHFLAERRKFTKSIKDILRGLSKEIKTQIGVDLYALLKEITANQNVKRTEDELLDEVMDLLRGTIKKEIDPFSGGIKAKAMKRAGGKYVNAPIRFKHKKG